MTVHLAFRDGVCPPKIHGARRPHSIDRMLCWRWACERRDDENRANLGRRRKPAASRTQAEVRNQQAGQPAAGPATALSAAETALLDPVRERREAVLLAPGELVPSSPQTLPGLLARWQNGQETYLHGIGIWIGTDLPRHAGPLILEGRRHRRPTRGRRGPRGPTRGTRGMDGDEL